MADIEIDHNRLKRRRVRINRDGRPNEEDIRHNNESYRQNMLIDNPWMIEEIEAGNCSYYYFLNAGIWNE